MKLFVDVVRTELFVGMRVDGGEDAGGRPPRGRTGRCPFAGPVLALFQEEPEYLSRIVVGDRSVRLGRREPLQRPEGVAEGRRVRPRLPWPVEAAATAEQERAAELRARTERARAVQPRAVHRAGSRSRLSPIERAARYVETMPPAIQGQDGSGALWRVAWHLAQHFRLDDAQAWPILIDYSARCQPPWSERELRHTWARAQRARVTHPGDAA